MRKRKIWGKKRTPLFDIISKCDELLLHQQKCCIASHWERDGRYLAIAVHHNVRVFFPQFCSIWYRSIDSFMCTLKGSKCIHDNTNRTLFFMRLHVNAFWWLCHGGTMQTDLVINGCCTNGRFKIAKTFIDAFSIKFTQCLINLFIGIAFINSATHVFSIGAKRCVFFLSFLECNFAWRQRQSQEYQMCVRLLRLSFV